MRRYFLIFILLTSYLFGCAVCQMQTPQVSVFINAEKKGDKTLFQISWEFDEGFTADTLIPFDKNANSIYEANELEEVKKSILGYIEQDHYLVFIKQIPKGGDFDKAPLLPFTTFDHRVVYLDKKMYYRYDVLADMELKKDTAFEIILFDQGAYFAFTIKNISFGLFNNPYETVNEYDTSKSYFYPHYTKKKDSAQIVKQEEKNFTDYLKETLESVKSKMNKLLEDIKRNNTVSSYLWLLFFSFLYGTIHAMGPGHGKSLVSAYFLSNDKSYFKAFNVSALIAVVHTFSAFILTFIIYYILNTYLSRQFANIEFIATKISAVVIIAIALYLIYTKFIRVQKAKNIKFSTTPVHTHEPSCGCGGCKTDSTDLGVILSAGIVPCPGTVTIFIFTISLGIYLVGFLSAIFMSLGMSLVIFVMAMLSIKVRSQVQRKSAFVPYLEYGSLVFILALGITLLIL